MYADAALAARIDGAEGRLVARMAGGAPPRAGAPGPLVQPIGGGLAVFAAPGSPINKVIGVGLEADLDGDELEALEEQWRARGEPVRIELSALARPSVPLLLTERGYRLHGFENVLGWPLAAAVPAEPDPRVAVERVDDRQFASWFAIAVEAFAHMDGSGSVADEPLSREQLQDALGQILRVEGLMRYLARIDGVAAGEAALSIEDGVALLAGSGTLPEFRGRGVQKALVARRLLDAREAGCDLAFVCTAPGSRSQANVMRRGFELLYTRAVLIKPL